MRRALLVGLFLGAFLPLGLLAQQTPAEYDIRTLTSLYESYLKRGGSDAYLEKRIADERTRIREQADEEVKAIAGPAEEPATPAETALPSAIDRQRGLVENLEERLRGLTVDLDLLQEDARRYYIAPASGTGASDSLRLTQTHGELLATTAVLEERIRAFEAGLSLQKDRLSKLNRTQWFEQFASLINFVSYALVILAAIFLDRFVRRRFVHRIADKNRRFIVAKGVTASIYVIAILWILGWLLAEYPNALASLAIVGAGLAVALQDIVKDFVGWILILQRRLFTLGDRVSVGNFTGDVIDIGPLRTTMLEVSVTGAFHAHERTGKTLNIPNSMMLREPTLNYNTTSDFMSGELQVTVTYDSNWRKAETILREALVSEVGAFTEQARKQQRRRTALFYTVWEVGEPEVHVDLGASGIQFTMKFTVPIGHRRAVITTLSRAVLERFDAEDDIRLAYNTIQIVGGSLPPT